MYSAPEKQWRTRRVLVLCVEPCRSVPPCPASITYRTAVADGTGREVAELDGETTNASLLALRVFVYSAPEKQWRTQRTLILADSWRRTVPFCPALPAVPAALNAIVRRCAVLWVETSERVRCARVRPWVRTIQYALNCTRPCVRWYGVRTLRTIWYYLRSCNTSTYHGNAMIISIVQLALNL